MADRSLKCLMCSCMTIVLGVAWAQAPPATGVFTDHTDVGAVLHKGSVLYDAAHGIYTITGSGENVWAAADAFHFVWKRIEGDFTLSADIAVLGRGGDPHKKAMLMARQSLAADAAYADAALHGVGLTSLQARDAKGGQTHEIQSNLSAPRRLRLQKSGDEFTLWLAGDDGVFHLAGGSMRVPLSGAFYVGLGVCAHNKDALETADFSNVTLEAGRPGLSPQTFSTLETITLASTDRRVTYVTPGVIAAPNWTPDGASLLFSREGRIESVPVAGGTPQAIDLGSAEYSINFHGISPDGTMLAVTTLSRSHENELAIFVVPAGGGARRRITINSPSGWQGWSPDGKTILFTALRNGRYGIYTIPVGGGDEVRLADSPAFGSAEYSPDGEYIYLTSDRSGTTEIWRMRPDGSRPEQLTQDLAGNWFPHVSPDSRLLIYLRPLRQVAQFPEAGEIELMAMTLADRQVRVLARLTGGPGTVPNPSWSPDSRRIAFVSYQGIHIGTALPQRAPAPAIVK